MDDESDYDNGDWSDEEDDWLDEDASEEEDAADVGGVDDDDEIDDIDQEEDDDEDDTAYQCDLARAIALSQREAGLVPASADSDESQRGTMAEDEERVLEMHLARLQDSLSGLEDRHRDVLGPSAGSVRSTLTRLGEDAEFALELPGFPPTARRQARRSGSDSSVAPDQGL